LLLAAARKRNVPVEIVKPGEWVTWPGSQAIHKATCTNHYP
jgi:hypothetical protein